MLIYKVEYNNMEPNTDVKCHVYKLKNKSNHWLYVYDKAVICGYLGQDYLIYDNTKDHCVPIEYYNQYIKKPYNLCIQGYIIMNDDTIGTNSRLINTTINLDNWTDINGNTKQYWDNYLMLWRTNK